MGVGYKKNFHVPPLLRRASDCIAPSQAARKPPENRRNRRNLTSMSGYGLIELSLMTSGTGGRASLHRHAV